jgi:hypothetical protein
MHRPADALLSICKTNKIQNSLIIDTFVACCLLVYFLVMGIFVEVEVGATFGRVTVNTPFSNEAFTLFLSALGGRRMDLDTLP